MTKKNKNGCYNCKYLCGDECEYLYEYIDIWFQEGIGESYCNFKYWEEDSNK